MAKVSKNTGKTQKKVGEKNAKKTPRGKGKPFTSENQPENKGRPKGSKDFSTYFDEVSKGKGKEIAIKMLLTKLEQGDMQALKLAVEYLFNKPTITTENINRNYNELLDMSIEELKAEIERIEKAL